jgi:hypothetical protein
MKSTYRNMITAGDDGRVVIHDLGRFVKVRSIDILEWSLHRSLIEPRQGVLYYERMSLSDDEIPRRLKCLDIHENEEYGGLLCVGTSFGEIVLMSIGTYM